MLAHLKKIKGINMGFSWLWCGYPWCRPRADHSAWSGIEAGKGVGVPAGGIVVSQDKGNYWGEPWQEDL